jgi:hypothetical protein
MRKCVEFKGQGMFVVISWVVEHNYARLSSSRLYTTDPMNGLGHRNM